ncbi:MAG TPA: RNB domain-containing ribonuclease [Fibrobacteraceae bacterium]|nr:RNB domain-containing ribonuclease [Fibrobacteraceae bacterium]
MSDAIPTPEQILALLKEEPLTSSELRGRLQVTKKHKLAFKAVLASLVESGVVKRNAQKRYFPAKPGTASKPDAPVYEGRPASRRRRMDMEDDRSSRIHKGLLILEDKQWSVRDSATDKLFRIPNRKRPPGRAGQTVVFELYPHPKHRFEMLAKIVANMESYGTFEELKAQFHHEYDLPPEFPPTVEKEIQPLVEPSAKDFKGRADYRTTPILCIDPLGARDHDDAVSVESLPKGGFRLGVHIADVSFYVKEGGSLDNEALERSFTQYLPWCAVPMLPEKLSAELCSLNEGVDRLAFTCMMELDSLARVQKFEFHRSVIRVTRSITYEQAMELYEAKDPEVLQLAQLTRLLKADRQKTGILELGSPEYKVDFDEKGEPKGITPRSSVESNSWIEECMLIANQCCAKELVRRDLQGVFRIHEPPDLDDIIELANAEPELVRGAPVLIKNLPSSRQGDSNLSPDVFRLYQYMVEKAAGIDPKVFKILRSMQKAHYDSNSFGHFALNWQDYAHFTSPIRRYADTWCHRELARTGKEIKARRAHDVAEVCDLISANEIRNQKCERAAVKVCGAWILREHVGENFTGAISGMEDWGIFVSLDNPPCDGLARFRDLPGDDFWFLNRERGCVVGRRSRQSFRRGDRVEVQVLRVNPIKGEIDLAILGKIENPLAEPESTNDKDRSRTRLARDREEDSGIPWDALKKRGKARRSNAQNGAPAKKNRSPFKGGFTPPPKAGKPRRGRK